MRAWQTRRLDERLAVVRAIDLKVRRGQRKTAAVRELAEEMGRSERYIWGWLAARGEEREALTPRPRPPARTAAVASEAWSLFAGFYLSPNGPQLAHAWRETAAIAGARGWSWPSISTVRRAVARIDPRAIVLARQGEKALRSMVPPIDRERPERVLEVVNFDGAEPSVMIAWPDGTAGRGSVLWAMDVATRCPLAWEIARFENRDQFRRLNHRVVAEFGVADRYELDNTRACANKEMTGGFERRNRFRYQVGEPAGIIKRQGTLYIPNEPGHPQAKPLERQNRDLKELVEKDSRVLAARAYCGDNPRERERHDKRHAIPLELFQRVVTDAFHELQRRNNGAFARRYAAEPIRRLPPAEQPELLLVAQKVKVRAPDAFVKVCGVKFWSEGLYPHVGREVIARFNPDDLTQPVRVEDLHGNEICEAHRLDRYGHTDRAGVTEAKRRRRHHRERAKASLEAQRPLSLAEVAAARLGSSAPPAAGAKVIRPERLGAKAAPLPASPTIERPAETGWRKFLAATRRRAG